MNRCESSLATRLGAEGRCRLLLTALLSLCMQPAPGMARTIGPDDRIVLPAARAADFSAVGKMICIDPATRVRVQTTMTLVGDRRTVIGAGHFRRATVDGRVQMIALEHCRFVLYGEKLETRFASGIARVVATGAQQPSRPDISRPDWAVLALAADAPPSVRPMVIAPMDKRALSRLDNVFMVAHHLNSPFPTEAKIYSPNCKPNALVRQQSSFMHLCDTGRGSSGGLLFNDGPHGLRAVGINIAESSENRNYGQLFQPEALRALPASAVDVARSAGHGE